MRARSVLIASALINLLLPAQAHDIYSHLTDQEGGSCCNERDCRPAPLPNDRGRSENVR